LKGSLRRERVFTRQNIFLSRKDSAVVDGSKGDFLKITIGFDVSKGYGDAEFINEAGSTLPQGGTYDDTAAGHQLLADTFAELNRRYQDTEFVVGLEASGGLERNWEKFFKTLKALFKVEVLILNPFAVKKHLESNLRRNRTDKISAANIADYLSKVRRKQDVEHESELVGARMLYRCILAATGRRVQAQCQLQSLLPQVQPELVQYCREGLPAWVLELLIQYPTPTLLAKARAKSVCKIKQQNKEIEDLRKTLIDSAKNHPDVKIIDSIIGLGLWTAVVLRLEYGTFDRFYSPSAAVAFAGLDPRIDQSGDVLQNLGISRAGHARIRTALYMPTLAAIRFNPVIRAFYTKLIAAGKREKVAQIACMRKLIHIIYACVITERPFDPLYEENHRKTGPITAKSLENSTAMQRGSADLTAPISRKEAKKRKAAAAPQKDQRPLNARSNATADNTILTQKTF
jgi:transposase